ncbi:unnamed protein product [Owenia fusiformis]|uniref:Myotrophin n=1 Tax=Owenia fusiformis TaxID=6347 RepID=A0A8S4P0R1_OWEFU|nr:unnamed protein product [Owenia fusiformis]
MAESLKWACENGDIDAVKNHIGENKDLVNTIGSTGRYPLHFAADYGQTEIIEYLVSQGADVNMSDKHGITPLLAAIWEGHTKSVQVLLDNGAKKDGKAPDGSSYIDSAEKEEIKNILR